LAELISNTSLALSLSVLLPVPVMLILSTLSMRLPPSGLLAAGLATSVRSSVRFLPESAMPSIPPPPSMRAS
jgi:hypothetical protein